MLKRLSGETRNYTRGARPAAAVDRGRRTLFEAARTRQNAFDSRTWSKSSRRIAIVPSWDYNEPMRIIALSTLKAYWSRSPAYADSIEPGLAWYRETLKANWATPNEVKAQFSSASILKDGRIVFNIAGNKYRLVVWISHSYRVVYIRFIGTHKQYDEIDAQTI